MESSNSGFYIFHKSQIKKNIDLIASSFKKENLNLYLSYSVKTNSSSCVLNEIKNISIDDKKVSAEAVSPYELGLVYDHGFNGNVIFNGVCKDYESFRKCILNNETVNIDGEKDFNLALKLNEEFNKPIALGLRLNTEIGNGIKSRFGIKTDSVLFQKILQAEKENKITVKGLSCHFTKSREIKYWKKRAELLFSSAHYFPHFEYADFGGGMYCPDHKDFPLYAEVIASSMKDYNINPNIKIILECGTPVISSAFDIESHVTEIKDNFIFLDISMLDFYLPCISDECSFTVIHSGKNPVKMQNAVMTGYTCLENDIIKKSFNGTISEGDCVIFRNTGAYSLSFANNFIKKPLEIKITD